MGVKTVLWNDHDEDKQAIAGLANELAPLRAELERLRAPQPLAPRRAFRTWVAQWDSRRSR